MIYIVLLLTFIFRLILLNQSLWLDEAIGALAAKNMSYGEILTNLMSHDNHPPLYYLLLKFWTSIFGYSETSLRMPSVLFGVGTVYLTYLIVTTLFPKKRLVGILASMLLATSQFHIYYSQEARMYTMAGFFAVLSIFAFLKTLKSDVSALWWGMFGISITAMMFSDYMPVFLLPVFPIAVLFLRKEKAWWKSFCISFIPLVIFGIWWLPYLKLQMESGKWLLANWPDWQKVAGGATVKQAFLVWMKFVGGRISFTDKFLYYGFTTVISVPFLISLRKSIKWDVKIVWLWLLFPLSSGFLLSFFFPAFIYFRYTYILPAFYILVAFGIGSMQKRKYVVLLMSAILLANLSSFLFYTTDANQQRENWRDAVSFVEMQGKSNEIALFEFPEPFAPYNWYATGKVEAKGATDSINATPANTTGKTKELINGKSGVYYFEYLHELSDPEDNVRVALLANGFTQKETYNFSGVGFVHYYTK